MKTAISFDKWWEENCMILSSDRTEAEDIYNLGVESQQAKIDDSENTRAVLYRENMDLREKNTDLQAKIELLEVQLKGAEERAKLILDHKNKMVDELQKENDRLNTWYKNVKLQLENKQIDCDRSDKERDELQARIGRALKNVEMAFDKKDWVVVEAIRILKGNKDEN